jgi:hypothetical protein
LDIDFERSFTGGPTATAKKQFRKKTIDIEFKNFLKLISFIGKIQRLNSKRKRQRKKLNWKKKWLNWKPNSFDSKDWSKYK